MHSKCPLKYKTKKKNKSPRWIDDLSPFEIYFVVLIHENLKRYIGKNREYGRMIGFGIIQKSLASPIYTSPLIVIRDFSLSIEGSLINIRFLVHFEHWCGRFGRT